MNQKANQLNILPETGQLFASQLQTITMGKAIKKDRLKALFTLYNLIFEELTSLAQIHFTTLFARIAFVSNQSNLSSQLVYLTHVYRKQSATQQINESNIDDMLVLGRFVISRLLEELYDIAPTELNKDLSLPDKFVHRSLVQKQFYPLMSVVIMEFDESESLLRFIQESDAHIVSIATLKHAEQSKELVHTFKNMGEDFQFPIQANFLDTKLQEDGRFVPSAIVLEPDFLINITAVAEGFKPGGTTILSYLTRKFIPTDNNIPILKGNIVNFVLDELIYNPTLQFEDLTGKIFKLFPEAFAVMEDQDLRSLISDLKQHFNHLKAVVSHEFDDLQIDKDKLYLEPSFYSPQYGLQGRLDLFHQNENQEQVDIIELKSGKLFRPNSYQINVNHFVQTLLYGLLIESAYGKKIKPACYILYSVLEKNRLKFAPTVRSKQLEAIHLRNKFLLLERKLFNQASNENQLIHLLNPENIPKGQSFIKRDATKFYKAYQQLDKIERAYLDHYIGFISREYQLSKTGEQGIEKSNGLAALWLDPIEEKQDDYRIMSHLIIQSNQSKSDEPLIVFALSEYSNKLSKFRKGDIAVIYPFDGSRIAVLKNQVFKCNIIDINDETVTVRLRFQQKNASFFDQFQFWNLEYDKLDSSYNSAFHGLYAFMTTIKAKRDLLLSRTAPRKYEQDLIYQDPSLTKEQTEIINQIINVKDYFLVWGPPGTGKTSFMLRHLVRYLFHKTQENVLILAYTNRAVDEICEAVSHIHDGFEDFIRIGSRHSSSEKFGKHLLTKKMKELFKLKQFDTIIVDEASQILEPHLMGLLPKAKRFVLIGDHKQLPAVVVQDERLSKLNDDELTQATGLTDMRNSLFERMYLQCKKQGWDWAIGNLSHQGRMHQEIMNYCSEEFYEKQLVALTDIPRLSNSELWKPINNDWNIFAQRRMIFIDTPVDETIMHKTNHFEAEAIAKILCAYKMQFELNGLKIEEGSIGVITPFRAQIAKILSEMRKYDLMDFPISVDTVERYQGSARDIVIISLTTNNQQLLNSMSNISEEGIDRKLNVALTRAKEQIVVLGNQKMLEAQTRYKNLIKRCDRIDYDKLIEIYQSLDKFTLQE